MGVSVVFRVRSFHTQTDGTRANLNPDYAVSSWYDELQCTMATLLTTSQQFLLAAGLSYEKSSRATNMVYTQMLFALGFDRFFFGTTPSLMSITGSTLILGSAIYMALQRESATPKQVDDGGEANLRHRDEEAVGLMGAMEGGEAELQDEMRTENVEMRRLR